MSSKRNKVSSKSQVHFSLLLHFFYKGLWLHMVSFLSFSKVSVVCYIGGYLSGFSVYRDLVLKTSGKAINNDITPFL